MLAEGGPYEASLKARNYENAKTALSTLRRNLLPEHKNTDVRELTRQDITGLMDKLTHGAAGDLRKQASNLLSWTRHQGANHAQRDERLQEAKGNARGEARPQEEGAGLDR